MKFKTKSPNCNCFISTQEKKEIGLRVFILTLAATVHHEENVHLGLLFIQYISPSAHNLYHSCSFLGDFSAMILKKFDTSESYFYEGQHIASAGSVQLEEWSSLVKLGERTL